MMIYRVIDKNILLFLELEVVLFKSSHYFTISNFWNSTIQELVYYISGLYGTFLHVYSPWDKTIAVH